jgi:hypothetical protein
LLWSGKKGGQAGLLADLADAAATCCRTGLGSSVGSPQPPPPPQQYQASQHQRGHKLQENNRGNNACGKLRPFNFSVEKIPDVEEMTGWGTVIVIVIVVVIVIAIVIVIVIVIIGIT